MKPSVVVRRFISIGVALSLLLSVGMFRQVSDASWYRFSQVTNQWMMAFSGLFGDSSVIRYANAQQVNTVLVNPLTWTPRSKKHRGLVGSWDMPFEMHRQRMHRADFGGNIGVSASYTNLPVQIDLNGDGLMDWVYSDVPSSYMGLLGGGDYFAYSEGEMKQYVVLKRANGFEIVYKCYQRLIDSNLDLYEYFGDCADDTYQGGQQMYEVAWTPANMLYWESVNWTNSTPSTSVADQIGLDFGIYDTIFDQVVIQGGPGNSSVELGDRHVPQFMDVNADGLPDVVFSGHMEIGIQTPSHPSTLLNPSLPFIMMNTGRGFELTMACLTQQPGYPLKEHYNIPSNQLPRCF